jgi:hypothetical protein
VGRSRLFGTFREKGDDPFKGFFVLSVTLLSILRLYSRKKEQLLIFISGEINTPDPQEAASPTLLLNPFFFFCVNDPRCSPFSAT